MSQHTTLGSSGASMSPETAEELDLEPLRGKRLLLVVTGALSASFTPYWVNWLHSLDLGITLRIVMTRSAERFVSPVVLSALVGRPVEPDTWHEKSEGILHVDLADWADAIIVHPCTFDYMSRIATGRGDSPSALALQSTGAPTVLCPALPPGTVRGEAYESHRRSIESRRAMIVATPTVGISASTGRHDASPPMHFPIALAKLAQITKHLSEGEHDGEPTTIAEESTDA